MDPAVAALDITKAGVILANMIESYLAGACRGAPRGCPHAAKCRHNNHGTIEPFSELRRPTLVREGERTMQERTAATGISGQALAPLGTASNRTRNRACTRAISDVLGAQKTL